MRISFFIFIHKKDKLSYLAQKQQKPFIKLFLRFGSREATEEWVNVFMDIPKLRKLRDKQIDTYLEKIITSTSWYAKIGVVMAISFAIVWFLIPLESKLFNLPPQP